MSVCVCTSWQLTIICLVISLSLSLSLSLFLPLSLPPSLPPVYLLVCLSVTSSSMSSTTCPVCMADYTRNELVKCLPCLHEFHSRCIGKWLKVSTYMYIPQVQLSYLYVHACQKKCETRMTVSMAFSDIITFAFLHAY